MNRLIWMPAMAFAIMGTANVSWCETSTAPIASFEDVAGKWSGHADRHSVTLEIEPSGRFTAKYALGGETGNAKLESGNLVIPLPQHDGTLQLVKEGDTLKGPGVIAGKTWNVSLVRSGPTVDRH